MVNAQILMLKSTECESTSTHSYMSSVLFRINYFFIFLFFLKNIKEILYSIFYILYINNYCATPGRAPDLWHSSIWSRSNFSIFQEFHLSISSYLGNLTKINLPIFQEFQINLLIFQEFQISSYLGNFKHQSPHFPGICSLITIKITVMFTSISPCSRNLFLSISPYLRNFKVIISWSDSCFLHKIFLNFYEIYLISF